MLGSAVKAMAVAMATAVALPYTSALLCNILMGWPQRRDKFRRAFHPRKVYALNWAVLQKLITSVRFAPLYVQWNAYYRMASSAEIVKNISFGRNDNTLDLYLPLRRSDSGDNSYPVVVFVYGGAWGSGDKNMYGMLCSAVANRLGAVVCCPNQSNYPKGYVDDMVQDVVDCVSWLHTNVHDYNGNKDKVMLLGHSSGAHLCAMAVLELLHEELVGTAPDPQSQPDTTKSMQFETEHFKERGEPDGDEESSGSSGSFCILNDSGNNGESQEQASGSSRSVPAETLSGQSTDKEMLDSSASLMERDLAELGLRRRVPESQAPVSQAAEEGEDEEGEEDSADDDSVVTVKTKDIEGQPSLLELSKTIKAVVGLAGVYDISDHFLHESMRGVEDVSSMARAMYGEEHFRRFSPTYIISDIHRHISLPKIVLLHGTDDIIVPVSSTTKFAQAVRENHTDITVRIIPSCDHYEICLDLMKSSRRHFNNVMEVLVDTAKSVF